ncbi:MAG: cation-translocating P-type ATPase [Candidatus Paceibacterota bacterium]|jgi:heavy metal translocating P-type ATPase
MKSFSQYFQELIFDGSFAVLLFIFLIIDRLHLVSFSNTLLVIASCMGLIPVAMSAFQSLMKKRVSVDLLASAALLAAFLGGEWSSAAFINLMLTAARIFGAYTEAKAHSAIQHILKLRPLTVHVKRGDTIEDISSSLVRVGDLLIVKSGERIAVDGTVEEGDGTIDQSSLTGESAPVIKTINNNVWSGTLLASGSLVIKTQKVGKDTTLEKTIALVERAEEGKAEIRTIADRFATWYIIIIFLGSFVIYGLFQDLPLLLSFLLVACADDIAIAIPMGFLASIGQAARRGVIIKGSNFLEGLAKTTTIIVDKTGTLTLGKFVVQEITPFGTHTREELLSYAGMTAMYSQHPISKAIVEYLREQKARFEKPDHIHEIPGKGLEALFFKKRILSGSVRFIGDAGIPLTPKMQEIITDAETHGLNINVIAAENEVIGTLACADEVRPEIKNAIEHIKKLGVATIIMLTGDNESVAARIAARVGITEYHANMLPEQKLQFVKSCVGPHKTVLMVGDGINDAAALALADVGIAMGAIGSDAAIEAADIALMKDDFSKIPEMIDLGRSTLRVVYQNFFIWGTVNIVGIILVSLRILGPEGASAYNFATDFFPIINSMRLFKTSHNT